MICERCKHRFVNLKKVDGQLVCIQCANDIEKEKSKRGHKQCINCYNIMYEYIDDFGDDYYKCSSCDNKIRIFHKPIRCVPRYPTDNRGCA